MGAASNILKNFNLFVDGSSYAGNVDELQLPNLTIKTEDYRAGGLDSTIALDMGMEKLESKFTLSKFDDDLLVLWGVAPGGNLLVTARGAVESLDGSISQIVVNMGGTFRSIEPTAWKAGERAQLALQMDLQFYEYLQDGRLVHQIDVLNMTRVIDGVDRLAQIRAAIGA